ncbi:MAG: M23 family metallopeptidase [Cytophagales bacterium]|nr:M23 family metallopeptidase [Cytophagales bacterium]
MKKFLVLIFLSYLSFNLKSQDYLFPVNPGIQNYVSGNLGELRGDRFHMGLDIKTNGKIGAPVYATSNGYIERIRVSGTGYGKVVYLRHQDGKKSVYAHLNKFNNTLENYVLNYQYRNKKFIVNLYPGKKFYYKKGEVLGFSGNSGSSGGPHLHFEIRDSLDNALNPLEFEFKEIIDKKKPTIDYVSFKTLNINSRVNNKFGIVKFPIKYDRSINIKLEGEIGISTLAFDRLDGSLNKVGINKFELYINDSLIISNNINLLKYSETNNVSWFIEPNIYKKQRKQYVKLYQDDGNNLSFHHPHRRGIISIDPKKEYDIRLNVYDSFNNKSSTLIEVNKFGKQVNKGVIDELFNENYCIIDNTLIIRNNNTIRNNIDIIYKNSIDNLNYSFNEDNYNYYLIDLRKNKPVKALLDEEQISFNFLDLISDKKFEKLEIDNLKININKNRVFDTLYLEFDKKTDTIEKFIFKNSLPFKNSIEITLKPDKKYDIEKSFVYNIKNKPSFVGGKWEDNQISFNTRKISNYSILEDNEPPEIKVINANSRVIKFKIEDKLSGINSYNGTINGNWILLEYDNKNKTIISKKLDPNKPFIGKFILEVFDNAKNKKSLILNL